jgi:hypothetical protein
MSSSMRFRGSFSFARETDATDALELLRGADCVISEAEWLRTGATLEIDWAIDASATLWTPTLLTLHAIAGRAVSGAVDATFADAETESVVAGGRPVSRESAASRRWERTAPELRAASRAAWDGDRRTVLVVYALASSRGDPSPGTPAFVFGELPALDPDLLRADRAPYITGVGASHLHRELDHALARTDLPADVRDDLRALRDWTVRVGSPAFGYQLEPPRIAGDGTARDIGLERERRRDPVEEPEDEDDEPDLEATSVRGGLDEWIRVESEQYTSLYEDPTLLHEQVVEARGWTFDDPRAQELDRQLSAAMSYWRDVTIAPFEISANAVTNLEWAQFMAETGARPPAAWSDPEAADPTLPVRGVSWEEAIAFARWAGAELPTQSQWQWSVYEDCIAVIGWEWCLDEFDETEERTRAIAALFGPDEPRGRVVRGGEGRDLIRSRWSRTGLPPDWRSMTIPVGFRLARGLTPEED